MGGHNHRFAPAEPVARGDVAGAPTLLQEFFDHAQGDAEAVGDLGAGPLSVVIRSQDSFAQIQR